MRLLRMSIPRLSKRTQRRDTHERRIAQKRIWSDWHDFDFLVSQLSVHPVSADHQHRQKKNRDDHRYTGIPPEHLQRRSKRNRRGQNQSKAAAQSDSAKNRGNCFIAKAVNDERRHHTAEYRTAQCRTDEQCKAVKDAKRNLM